MSYSSQGSVGFISASMYLPEQIVTAADIALESGIEEWVIRDKSGITEKRMAGPEDHRRGECRLFLGCDLWLVRIS